jgi:hypothetical protein
MDNTARCEGTYVSDAEIVVLDDTVVEALGSRLGLGRASAGVFDLVFAVGFCRYQTVILRSGSGLDANGREGQS